MNRRSWTESELAVLRQMWPRSTAPEIHAVIPNRAVHAIYAMAARMGLEKDPDYHAIRRQLEIQNLLTHGKKTRFRKGNVSHNKGTKGITGNHPNSIRTWFKPGGDNGKSVQIGTELVNSDGYLVRKVNDLPKGGHKTNWVFVHRVVWEEHHGPIPEGHSVAFRNGNRLDVSIENLELATRRDLMRRNSIQNFPAPIQEAVWAQGQLTRVINSMQEKASERIEEQSR